MLQRSKARLMAYPLNADLRVIWRPVHGFLKVVGSDQWSGFHMRHLPRCGDEMTLFTAKVSLSVSALADRAKMPISIRRKPSFEPGGCQSWPAPACNLAKPKARLCYKGNKATGPQRGPDPPVPTDLHAGRMLLCQ